MAGDTDYDAVVIGGGGAGLAAAVSAAERGASVILFESEGELGGSTQLSAGLFTAAATSVQKELGVEDTVDRFFQHYMDLNQWLLKPGLVRRFCELAGPTLEWMLDLGLEVPAQVSGNAHQPGLCRAGVEDVWRGHVPKDQGYGLVQVLDRARRAHGIDAVLHTRVERLLVAEPQGSGPARVTGVVADGVELTAGAVVVASGGLAQDPALVERWFPDALRAGESLFVVAAEGSRGDHLAYGEQVRAAVAGDGWGLMLPTAEFVRHHHWQAGFPPPSRVHVNGQGRRFMDEDANYAVSGGLIEAQGGPAWMVFDEAARTALPDGYADWDADRVLELVGTGQVTRADDLPGLAAAVGVPADHLVAAVERWNAQLPHGSDVDFQRDRTLAAKGVTTPLAPIAVPPFYATCVLPTELVCTHAGLEIDTSAAVLDVAARPIPGLYAAGEAGGGVLGNRYVGGGNAVANALTMGRLAGQSAAAALGH
ncbi:FAD-dependent oxidoreductase [Nocardioides zeae]|uniref:FAD-dependent oxidoreductase n=1 Tax=Nocardioides imazamoxiresistens TaxID=3231893 RepID=A0ABU3PUM7_9ACTN|nr:FAD-dependent oxidoreductase [Nocardioides zeae]MDT9592933.1 FAD-dependent oxidoreductase [Nocardioides zeae]